MFVKHSLVNAHQPVGALVSKNRKQENQDIVIIAGSIITIVGLLGVVCLSMLLFIVQLKSLNALPNHAKPGTYWPVSDSDIRASYLYLLSTIIVLVIGVVMTLHGLLSKFGHHDCNNQVEN